jgi:hypothetical protein
VEAQEGDGMTKETKPKTLDPMLEAALDRMIERGPVWLDEEAQAWGDLFVATVALIYPGRPPKPPRKSRTKPE